MFLQINILNILLLLSGLHQGISQSSADHKAVDQLRYQQTHNGDGNYNFGHKTSNDISVHETGYIRNPDAPMDNQVNVKEGCNSYFSPEGYFVSTVYIADESGYRPKVTMTHPRDAQKHQEHLANPCGTGVTPEPGPIPPRNKTTTTPQPPCHEGWGHPCRTTPPKPTCVHGWEKSCPTPTTPVHQKVTPTTTPKPRCIHGWEPSCRVTSSITTTGWPKSTPTTTTKPGCLHGWEASCRITTPKDRCIQGWEPSCSVTTSSTTTVWPKSAPTTTTKPGCLHGWEASCRITSPKDRCIHGWEPSCPTKPPTTTTGWPKSTPTTTTKPGCLHGWEPSCSVTTSSTTTVWPKSTPTTTTKPGCLHGWEPSCRITTPMGRCIHGWEPSCPTDITSKIITTTPVTVPIITTPGVPPECPCQKDNLHPFAFRLLDHSLVQVSYPKGGYPNKPTVTVYKNGSEIPYHPDVTILFVDDSYLAIRPKPTVVFDDTDYFKSRARESGHLQPQARGASVSPWEWSAY